ncbi:restriction endonuclease subunit S [Shewanella sp. FDAARGOS_354]|uniref:restriction endonuclease subunit S n=1 Tax=Shewanella sp. FDAARGOS_354 TaxID=1930557 RepID=UPI001D026E79|nr:restriction endonuclease subunit S [Shewanella sp. FDAARGOS_354]
MMSLGYIGENIPAEWEKPLLTELVSPKQWKTISTKDLLEEGFVVYGANGKIGFYNEFTHENPTLMITCRGATCGNLHISEPFSYINGNAMALDEQPVDLIGVSFLRHVLEARGLEDTISGSAQPQITRQGLSDVRIPLPPLAEQKVIADKLDTLLAQVETTKARLDRIPEILKRFRQSVLSAAVSGKLISVANPLMVKIGDVVSDIRYGTSKKCDYNGGKTPVIRIPNIGDRKLDISDLKSADFTEKELKALALKPGDILVIRSNGSLDLVAKPALVESKYEGFLYAGYLIRIRCNEGKVLPSFLLNVLSSRVVRDVVEIGARSTSGVNNINSKELASLVFVLPSIDEQAEICHRVEELFSFADSIEQKATAALARVNNLTLSILAKAFRGELTAEWRAANPELIGGDNSAAALLERIKAERAVLAPSKKSRASKKV